MAKYRGKNTDMGTPELSDAALVLERVKAILEGLLDYVDWMDRPKVAVAIDEIEAWERRQGHV